jgi:hypothetical protein
MTAAIFNNDSSFRVSADVTLSGMGNAAGGIRISPWYSQYVDGRCQADSATGEIACFGGRLPFYNFSTSHGVTYAKGTTIRMEAADVPHSLSSADPAVVRYRVIYGGRTYDSPPLPFDQGNTFEDPPYGLWGILNNARVGGFFQEPAQPGNSMTAEWSNILFLSYPLSAELTLSPTSLSPNSRGRWIRAYIEPGPGFSAGDIDVASIRLNGTVPVAAGTTPSIGDFDDDGVADLEARYDRLTLLSTMNGNTVVTVSGYAAGGPFVGQGQVRLPSQ